MIDLEDKNQLYLDDLLKPSKKLPYCEISFGLINEEMKRNVSLTPAYITPYSVKDSTILQENNYKKLIGTLEPNFFKLNGNYVLWDGVNKQWVTSAELIENGGLIRIYFDKEYNFEGLTIVWSNFLKEYAVDFSVINYNLNGTKINEINITNNTQTQNVLENSFETTYRIEIKVTKWSNELSRRIRIERLDFGRYIQITNEDLSYVNLVLEGNPLSTKLPINELSFRYIDINNTFNPDNPEGKSKYLTTNLPISLKFVENVYNSQTREFENIDFPLGEFYLSEWADGGSVGEYEFKASNLLGLLDKDNYYKGMYYPDGILVKDLINNLLNDLNLPASLQGRFVIGKTIGNKKIYAPLPIDTHKNCLQLILNAVGACLIQKRDGTYLIDKDPNTQLEYILDGELIYNNLPKAQPLNPLRGITAYIYTYTISDEITELAKNDYELEGTETLIVEHNPGVEITVEVSAGTLNSEEHYTNASILKITHSGQLTIAIKGKALESSKTAKSKNYVDKRGTIINENGEVTTLDNELVTTMEMLNNQLESTLNESVNRNIYELSALNDFRLDVLDRINLKTTNSNAIPVKVTKKNFSWGPETGSIMDLELRGGNY